jgi:hypothetical protein
MGVPTARSGSNVSCIVLERHPRFVISTDDEGAVATETKWRDPDNVSSAMLMQGVLFKLSGCYPRVSMRDGFHCKFWVYILSSPSGTPEQSLERIS